MTSISDHQAIAALCKAKLDLISATAGDDWYQSLPLCVIDTVFSIGARYTSTRNTVLRFCTYFGLQCFTKNNRPSIETQFSVTSFIDLYDTHSIDFLAQMAYQNTQRTSPRGGILKADAALRYSRVLQEYAVNYLQDIDAMIGNLAFEAAIQQIPGHRSGVSLRYFYILTGSADHVKPDRMILRFIQAATGKEVSIVEAQTAIIEVSRMLNQEYPHLTPALLDNLIWQYQRTQVPV